MVVCYTYVLLLLVRLALPRLNSFSMFGFVKLFIANLLSYDFIVEFYFVLLYGYCDIETFGTGIEL